MSAKEIFNVSAYVKNGGDADVNCDGALTEFDAAVWEALFAVGEQPAMLSSIACFVFARNPSSEETERVADSIDKMMGAKAEIDGVSVPVLAVKKVTAKAENGAVMRAYVLI